MGLNAYFAYQVVGFHGTGSLSYRMALAAVFIEGFVFLFLALTGMRQWLVRLLPNSIKIASGCGIGLFLAEVGLSYSSGIGAITGGGTSTPLDLAGCPPKYLDTVTGACNGHKMENPTVSGLKHPEPVQGLTYVTSSGLACSVAGSLLLTSCLTKSRVPLLLESPSSPSCPGRE